jgi:hypothetical protein
MKYSKEFFLVLLLGLIGEKSFSQITSSDRIRGDFSRYTFEQFAKEIETKTYYHFYYRASDVDSLEINLGVRNERVPDLLKEIFSTGDLHFAIDPEKNVFITRDREIFTQLLYDPSSSDYTGARNDVAHLEEIEKPGMSEEDKVKQIGVRTSMVGNATLTGYIRDAATGEAVIGASVYVEKQTGAVTDQFGYYTITLPKGRYELMIKSVGMKTTRRQVMLNATGKLDIEVHEEITALKEVVVSSERDQNVRGMQMGLEKFDMKIMRQVPVALGEYDVVKVLLALPGVQTVGEGASGFNVRGGATNQNLILFNDAVIYNPSHLFGFFSAFNPDVVKTVELYKSGIPAEYGGRLSSVLEVNSPEGNKKKFSGSGGISPITGRLTLEGPIIKDKTSFLIGARSTYSDWLLKKIHNKALNNSDAAFYDINANLTHQFNDNNTVYLTGYISKDNFRLNSDTVYEYQNKTATLKWKHTFGPKLYGVLTGSYSGYHYEVQSKANVVNAFQLQYDISQLQGKADFNYFLTAKQTVNFGVSTIKYKLNPGNFQPLGEESLIMPDVLQTEQGLESAVYVGDNFEITPKLSVYGGLRYSLYNFLGPSNVTTYQDGVTKSSNSAVDTIAYGAGEVINTYKGPEFRASARYSLSNTSSLKISFNRMRQYIQMLSNTTAISPTDIWKLSDPYIKPQIGDQISIGYYKNLKSSTIETSVEAYYKTMQNFLDYKSGATLILNHNIEQDAVNAQGKAYGIEFLVKKTSGKLNGWVSYAYSRSLLRAKSEQSAETINNGEYYPSNYDKPHAVNFIGNYKVNRRFSMSLNVTYSTGRPITLPLAKYELNGAKRLYYSDRNQYRIPDYFRTDFALNVEGNHKIKKLAHSSWTFAIYNLTGRRNAYSVYFVSQDGGIKGYKLSIFGNAIPTITYNFKF